MLYSCPYNEKGNRLEENPVGDNYFCLTFFCSTQVPCMVGITLVVTYVVVHFVIKNIETKRSQNQNPTHCVKHC